MPRGSTRHPRRHTFRRAVEPSGAAKKPMGIWTGLSTRVAPGGTHYPMDPVMRAYRPAMHTMLGPQKAHRLALPLARPILQQPRALPDTAPQLWHSARGLRPPQPGPSIAPYRGPQWAGAAPLQTDEHAMEIRPGAVPRPGGDPAGRGAHERRDCGPGTGRKRAPLLRSQGVSLGMRMIPGCISCSLPFH